MSCPVCHFSHLKESDSECPECKTPMTTLQMMMEMKYNHRKEHGEKIAMSMLVIVLFLVSVVFVYLYNVRLEHDRNKANSGNQMMQDSVAMLKDQITSYRVLTDSLRQQVAIIEATPSVLNSPKIGN